MKIDDSETELIKKNIGDPLKKFIIKNFVTIKKFSLIYHISPSYLSKVIHGKKKASEKLKLLLTRLGFDESVFYNYINIEADSPKLLIYELKKLIDRQNTLLDCYRKAIVELRNDYDKLRKMTKNDLSRSIDQT